MADQLAPGSVKSYRLDPAGFAAARNKLLRQRIGLLLGIVVFAIILQYRSFGLDWHGFSIASALPVLLPILIVLGALFVGVMRGIKRNQESWNSYELLIGQDFLLRRIKEFPELEIQRYEITKIRETSTGLSVETAQKGRAIGIAPSLVDYEDAKEQLSRWVTPVQELRQPWMTPARWSSVLGLLTLILFAALYLTDKSWLIVVTAVPLIIALSASIWLIRRSVQVSSQTKRLSFWVMLPLLAVTARLILAIIHWR